MSLYKLAQFVFDFIRTKRPGFYPYETFPNQLHCAMIEEDDNQE